MGLHRVGRDWAINTTSILFYVVTQSCRTLCDPTDCSLPGSSVRGVLQARILELPFPSPGDLPDPEIEPGSPVSPALEGGFSTTEPPE